MRKRRNNNRVVDGKIWCPLCCQYLDKGNFYKNVSNAYGVSSQCKICNTRIRKTQKIPSLKGTENDHRVRVSDDKLNEIAVLRRRGYSYGALAERFGMSRSGMTYVINTRINQKIDKRNFVRTKRNRALWSNLGLTQSALNKRS